MNWGRSDGLKLGNCYSIPTFTRPTWFKRADMGVRSQGFPYSLAQFSSTLAMDDAHEWKPGQVSGIQVVF